MKKKYIIYPLIVVIIGGLFFLKISSQNKKKFTSVKTAVAHKGEVKAYLSTTATIKSKNSKSYYGVQGKVKKINVSVGDKVSKSQVLITFETQDLNVAVKQAELQYNNAVLSKQDLENQNNNLNSKIADLDKQIADLDSQISALGGNKNAAAQIPQLTQQLQTLKSQRSSVQTVSGEKLQQADNAISLAKVSLDNARQNLAKNVDNITADFDGVVTSLNVVEGAMNSGGQPAVVVQDIENLKLQVSVGKYDANKVKLGQEAVVKSDNNQYKGSVSFISPAAQKAMAAGSTDTSLGIEIDVLEKAPDLKIDFDTDVDVLLGKASSVIKIPAECIKTDKTGKNFVYVVEGNKAVEKVVTLGLQSDTEVEVASGIKEGDKVILNPGVAVKNGSLVKEAVGGTK